MQRVFVSLGGLMIMCGVALAQNAQAGEPVRVGIVPGVAVGVDAAKVDALAEELADALKSELVVDAIGGLEVRRKLPADGIPQDCVVTPACVASVAKQLGAKQLLFVVFIDSGGTLQVDSTWIDTASGKSVSRPAIDISQLSLARERFVAAARQLLPDAPVRPKPKALDGKMSEAVPRHITRPALITAGAAVVGLADGIVFGLRTRSRYNACKADTAACSTDEREAIRTNSVIADIGFFVAVGGAIATGVLWATSGKEPHLIVTPEQSGGAVSVIGRF